MAGIGLAEHHALGPDLPSHEAKFAKAGFKPWWTQAEATAAGGSTGGTAVALSRSWSGARLDLVACDAKTGLPFKPDHWTAVTVRGADFRFIWVSLYLVAGQPLGSGVNFLRLQGLATWLRLVKVPWIITADWNHPPDELRASLWPDLLGACVVPPEHCELTCTTGGGACSTTA